MDASNGWNEVADQFMTVRSNTGAQLVRSWARDNLKNSGTVIDIGCGTGMPIAHILMEEGYEVFGIDASPNFIAAFRRHFPYAQSACESAQDSAFFHRRFNAAIAVGLLFLLNEDDQRKVIHKIAKSLEPGGRFLFSAPREKGHWRDSLTGRRSVSLGEHEYEQILKKSGLKLAACLVDEGESNYYNAVRDM